MQIPEGLYVPSAKDAAGFIAEITRRRNQSGLAAVSVSTGTFYTVPQDSILILQFFSGLADPGAGQNVAALSGVITQPGDGTAHTYFFRGSPGAADENVFEAFTGEVWCPPGAAFAVVGTFNAGVAVNNVHAVVHGLLIPKGQIR